MNFGLALDSQFWVKPPISVGFLRIGRAYLRVWPGVNDTNSKPNSGNSGEVHPRASAGIAMTKRGFVIVLNVGIFVLLVVLVMEAAGMRRSLRRIEREERARVHGQANHLQVLNAWAAKFHTESSADSLWQNATDGAWILVPFSGSGTCSNCGAFYHRFFTKEGCEGALAEWNAAINEQRVRQATGPIFDFRIVVLGNCEAHPLASVTWHSKHYVYSDVRQPTRRAALD